MKLQPCEGCIYRVDTGREWPKGTPYHECHRRAPVILPNEDGRLEDSRPGANGMGCGERSDAISESVFDVRMRQEVEALKRIAAAVEALADRPVILPSGQDVDPRKWGRNKMEDANNEGPTR